jgi:phosphate-selective porin
LAGRYGEFFYLRDADDLFRLYLQGRAHIDGYVPLGPGLSDLGPALGLKPTVFLRRARVEISGEFLTNWQWLIGGEWGQSAVDNPAATTGALNCSVDAKTGASSCSQRAGSVEAANSKAAPTDVLINYRFHSLLNFQVGQFKLPFTLENRTSENVTPFLENSLAVRNLGTPLTSGRDIGLMIWGLTKPSYLHYSVGLFNAEGANRPNVDSNGDVVGRVFAHPFVEAGVPLLARLQLGVSFRYGFRSAKWVGYDVNAYTTSGGYAFWRPTYTDSNGNLVHIIPSGRQSAFAAELYWPVSRFDLLGEFVYISNNTREARDFYQQSAYTERFGSLQGYAYYATLGYWIFGERQYVRRPGYLDPSHIDFTKPTAPSHASLEALARFEQLRVTYDGASRQGSTADAKTPSGDINVNAFTLGLNYWATRRVRITANYTYYNFPDSAPASASATGGPLQTSAQRAVAPGQNLARGLDDSVRDTNHGFHELSFRFGVGF